MAELQLVFKFIIGWCQLQQGMTQVASKIGAVNTLRDNPGEGFVKEDVPAVTAWAQLLLEVLPGEGEPEAAMQIGTAPR